MAASRIRRALAVVLLVLGLVGLTAGAASAKDPKVPIPGLPGVSVPVGLPSLPDSLNPTDVCNNLDAPIPASPYGDGSWIVRMSPASEALIHGGHAVGDGGRPTDLKDPFTDEGVSLESTYGTTPQWWTYDNGCGGRWLAGAGTSLGNAALQLTGMLPNWTEALISAVIDPSGWTEVLDQPVAQATEAVAGGVWGPWVGVVLILVAVLVMLRSRGGQVAGAITAIGWALGVLVLVSWLIQYPVESVRMVDAGVRTAVVGIATGFNDAEHGTTSAAAATGPAAVVAIDEQMDDIVRSTQYRTWLDGVFGDADSRTAEEYGPRVFRATHFTWAEYDAYAADPGGKGKRVLAAKQADFKKAAEEIKEKDPVAYSYFKGDHYGQRLSLVAVNGLVLMTVCAFMMASALAILAAFVLIRILVPFAPAAGVVYMLETTRDMALGLFKKVVGPLVMGPVFFVVGMLLLRFDSAVLTAEIWFPVRLGLVAIATVFAWKLCRPATYGLRIPGIGNLRRTLVGYAAARAGAGAGVDAATDDQQLDPAGLPSRPRTVYQPVGEEVAAPALSTSRNRGVDDGLPVPIYQPAYRRDLDGDWIDRASLGPAQGGSTLLEHDPAGLAGRRAEPAEYAHDSSFDDYRENTPRRPAESNVDLDEHGNQVFVIYTPDGLRNIPVDRPSSNVGAA
jgi:hypothetical protein